MRILLFSLLLSTAIAATAQELDYPDYRSKKDNFAKIQEKNIRADVSTFALAGVDESIGKSPLATIPVKDYGSDYMRFEGDNIQVTIKTGVFFQTKHKMMFSEKHLVRIDNKPYYGGTYGDVPKSTIASLIVIVGKDTVAIPPVAYFDLYNPSFSFNQSGATRSRNGVYLSADKKTFYIYMFNMEGGGSEFTWVIQDKAYLRRVVDFGFLH